MNTRSPEYYGWNPDLPDFRDQMMMEPPALMRLPELVDLRAKCPPVFDQGELGSCTANAIAAMFAYEQQEQDLPPIIGSRLFLYFNAREIEGMTGSDNGAMIRDGIKTVVRDGLCPEEDWPYDVDRFAEVPPPMVYAHAQAHQAIRYRRIGHSLHSMKHWLANGRPFVFGFTVYDGFESEEVAASGVLNMPGPEESMVGGHAVMAVGFNEAEKRFLIRNSWGLDWGKAGYFTMPYEYFVPELTDDFWTITKVEA